MSNFIPDKPFLEYEEMIDLLRSRNLQINNEEIPFAIHALQTYSYYDLINGNIEKLINQNLADTFIDGTSIGLLVRIKIVEERLRSIFLAQLLAIEKKFCTKLSWYISKEFGVDSNDGGYLKKGNYSTTKTSLVNKTMKRLRSVRDSSNTKREASPSLKYYQTCHNHIPPWILINDLMFGEVIYWYRCLNTLGKDKISENFFLIDIPDRELRLSLLLQMLDLLREYRNFLAHNNALGKMKSSRSLDNSEIFIAINDPSIINIDEFSSENSNNLYACFISLLLLTTDLEQLQFFLLSLEQVLNTIDVDEQKLIFEETFGLPLKLFTVAKKIIEKRGV